jgi:hypothetical protein
VIGALVAPLRWLITYMTNAIRSQEPEAASQVPTPTPTPDKPPMAPATAPFDPTADRQAIADAMEKQRELLRTTGTAFTGAIGFVLTALGLTKLFDVFPIPPDPGWRFGLILALICAGTLAAFIGAVAFAGGFFRAQRRILVGTGSVSGLRGEDARVARKIYTEHARENEASDIRSLELRALRYERIARSLPQDDQATPEQIVRKKSLRAEADRINDVVAIALARAAVAVLERRSEAAFGSKRSTLAAVLTVFGIALIFGTAAYSKGERDLIDLRAKCQAAVEKGATDACDPVRRNPDQPPNLEKLQNDLEKSKTEAANLKGRLKVALARAALPEAARNRLRSLERCAIVLNANTELKAKPEQVADLCALITR